MNKLSIKIIILFSFLAFLNASIPLEAKAKKKISVTLLDRGSGMFSVMYDVLGLLIYYEAKKIEGMEVNFGTTGAYYDKEYGPNWWCYYFEPLQLGSMKETVAMDGYNLFLFNPFKVEKFLSRGEAYRLVTTYIKVKPAINEEVDAFVELNFSDCYMIGVHYRGTDKNIEAPRVPYEDMKEAILDHVKINGITNYKIFVATDEIDFLNFIISSFGEGIVCYNEATRSFDNQPIHKKMKNHQYERGKEALIDCLLLAKVSCLIRTSSNLSKFSTFLNTDLKVIEMNERYKVRLL